jgi:hypothetical protein
MKNGKGLAAIVLSSALVGALNFSCQKIEYLEREKSGLNLNSISSQNKGQNSLEQYFFQNGELKSATAYLGKIRWENNEFESFKISKGDALKEAGFGDEVNNLEQAGRAVYSLPNGTKVLLMVKEYKSEELASQAEVSQNYGQVVGSPFMVQKGKFLISTENIDEIIYGAEGAIDSEDKKEFAKIWKEYINRTGGEPNLTIDSKGELNHTGLNKDLASKVEDAAFAQIVREQEAQNNPEYWEKVISEMPKDGQEDFFDYLTPAENEKPKLQSTTPKEVGVGINVLSDVFNLKADFYRRFGKIVNGKEVYTTSWEKYGTEQENGRGEGILSHCHVTLEDPNSFVELKAITVSPEYENVETSAYRFDWDNNGAYRMVDDCSTMYSEHRKK